MTHGFNLDDPLVCEGIIGDGCGGGRIFYVKDGSLIAYDPFSKDNIILLENICDCISISKKVCIITIRTKTKTIEFDLSKLK